jgi:regulatory protein YycH of two-component signal transduction system YycFG
MSKPDVERAKQLKRMDIKIIQMGKAFLVEHLGWTDNDYRDELARLSQGKRSSTELTWQQRQAVIKRMKELGFVVRSNRSVERVDDTVSKLRAIWFALAEVGAVERPKDVTAADAAIEAWAKRMQPELAAVRFASGYQMQRLIEAAKRWAKRVGAELE